MASTDQKILAFEYLIDQLVKWHNEICGTSGIPSDFTILKLIKLNFFTTAVTSSPSEKGLLTVFDNYYALPLGHVESDIYSNRTELRRYIFNGSKLEIRDNPLDVVGVLDEELRSQIDNAIKLLRHQNDRLISYPPMALVEISHKWNSWKSIYNFAKRMGKRAEKIPTVLIQNDLKYYYL